MRKNANIYRDKNPVADNSVSKRMFEKSWRVKENRCVEGGDSEFQETIMKMQSKD